MSLQSKLALCCCAVAVTLAGCAVNKDWVAAGGSRADGTVKLAYEYGEFQKPALLGIVWVDFHEFRGLGAWKSAL